MNRRTLLAALVGGGLAIAGTVDLAAATTGSTNLPAPKVRIARAITDRFKGNYYVGQIAPKAKVRAGQVVMDYSTTEKPYLIGYVSLQTVDADGRESTFVANLYPFTYKKRVLRANVLSQASNAELGRVTFRLGDDGQTLSGTLRLHGITSRLVYRPFAEDVDRTAPLPPAKQADPTPVKLTRSGLGASDKRYYGRYALQADGAAGATEAGLYAPVVRSVAALAPERGTPDSGSLTLFGNQVRKGKPLVPAGILTLHEPGSTDVAYLTDFKWGGERRSAAVRGGSTEGPVVGSFTATFAAGGITAALEIGGRRTPVRFSRTG